MRYAQVAFPIPQDQTFSYLIPEHLQASAQPGSRVLAPLGASVREGVIVELTDTPDLPDPSITIKPLTDCLDDTPTFSETLLKLTRWVASAYLSSWGEALKCAAPSAIQSRRDVMVRLLASERQLEDAQGARQKQILRALQEVDALSVTQLSRQTGIPLARLSQTLRGLKNKGLVQLTDSFQSKTTPRHMTVVDLAVPVTDVEQHIAALPKRASRQRRVLQLLADTHDALPIESTAIYKQTGVDATTLQAMERKGLIKTESISVVRNPLSLEPVPPTKPLPLNAGQSTAFQAINEAIHQNAHKVFLLHGVTGSGKTEVYMQSMAEVLAQGKDAIVLVPEIALTPQTVSRFVGRFGERVAVLHSNLSAGERYDQWQRIKKGDADVVVGPRSAIFAPLETLGIIIIDEEHETTYKQQEPAPRYHARDVAIERARLSACPVVLGTATPSLESFYQAQRGQYHLLSLPSRVSNIAMPHVSLVDMREELKRNNRSIFSDALRTAIASRLEAREQVMLFLNRRGYSTYVFCRTCGYVEKCANCSVSLTFHFQTRRMKCHHCGHERPTSRQCPQCGSVYIRYFGIGTEQVEQEVVKTFPNAKVQRMDTDTTTRKNAHQEILDAFRKQQIDILVGTQMIAKGLDFPNVTLVGVISADTALNLPDFRAGERTFNLLTQVAGRSGRSLAGGEVIVQTYTPEHYSIQAAAAHDYLGFYQEEVGYREGLGYPPISRAATILLRGPEEAEVVKAANDLLGCLEITKAEGFPDVEIRGPVAAPLAKIQGKHRWHFMLRAVRMEDLLDVIRQAIQIAPANVNAANIDLIVDIEPLHMM